MAEGWEGTRERVWQVPFSSHMQPHRKIILALTLLLVGGSLSFTTAYGLRLRSDSYRHKVEAGLSSFFKLPSEIGRIRGRTFSSRAFEDVTVHLPDRRDRVFSCKTAIWHLPHPFTSTLPSLSPRLCRGSTRPHPVTYRVAAERLSSGDQIGPRP